MDRSGAITRIREEIDPYAEKSTQFLRERGGSIAISDADAITFTTHLVKRSSLLKETVSSGMLAEIAADLVGPDVRLYWDQAVYKKPESPAPSRGTRTTATRLSSRSSTSRAGSR